MNQSRKRGRFRKELTVAKMSAEERKKFFLAKLEEQRHLLKTAIDGMAAGDLTQALHVAALIRVLVHETGASKPLLGNLRNNYLELPILDRIPEAAPSAPPGVQVVTFFCPLSAQMKAPEGTISLITELNPKEHALSTLGTWWRNSCMILPGIGRVDRRELILGLSNKEGGAHVDADISEKYQALMASKFFSVKINDKDLGAVNISRLVAGKAGVELLDCLERNFPR
jgi:hypothetical protein